MSGYVARSTETRRGQTAHTAGTADPAAKKMACSSDPVLRSPPRPPCRGGTTFVVLRTHPPRVRSASGLDGCGAPDTAHTADRPNPSGLRSGLRTGPPAVVHVGPAQRRRPRRRRERSTGSPGTAARPTAPPQWSPRVRIPAVHRRLLNALTALSLLLWARSGCGDRDQSTKGGATVGQDSDPNNGRDNRKSDLVDWSAVPDDLRWVVGPAKKYGTLRFEGRILEHIDEMDEPERAEARRLRARFAAERARLEAVGGAAPVRPGTPADRIYYLSVFFAYLHWQESDNLPGVADGDRWAEEWQQSQSQH